VGGNTESRLGVWRAGYLEHGAAVLALLCLRLRRREDLLSEPVEPVEQREQLEQLEVAPAECPGEHPVSTEAAAGPAQRGGRRGGARCPTEARRLNRAALLVRGEGEGKLS
jgi:hypothetical protein